MKLYKHNGNVYIILRELPYHSLIDKNGTLLPEALKAWKDRLGADHVLKNKTHYIFCETVEAIDFEEIYEDEQPNS